MQGAMLALHRLRNSNRSSQFMRAATLDMVQGGGWVYGGG